MGGWHDKTHTRAPVKSSARVRPRMVKRGFPFRVTLLSLFLVIGVSACDREEPVEATGVLNAGQQSSQTDIAGSLIRRSIEQPGGKHVAVEIDAGALEDLMNKPADDESSSVFRDPVQAAKLFAAHIGVPEDAMFAILEQSQQPEDGSGLFIAIVQVTGADRIVQMRMVSEPDPYDQPTLWVLNDYQR